MAEPVIIHNRPFWARILTVFWAVEVAVGLVFAGVGASWLGAGENGLAGVTIGCGLLLAVVGVVMTGVSWRVWRLGQGPAIEMRDGGLVDRRIADATIPWAAISWAVIFNGRSYSLQFDVAPPERAALDVHWEQRLMGRFNRLFNYPELTMVTLGTAKSAHALGSLMESFKSPRR